MTGSTQPSGFDPSRLDAIRAQLAQPRASQPSAGPRVPSGPAPNRPLPAPANRRERQQPVPWLQAAIVIVGFTALLYLVEFIDGLTDHRLDHGGIEPRTVDGLWGILFAPVLHASWNHLAANTIPLLILGFLVLLSGVGRGIWATAIIWLIAGAGTWLTGGAHTVHLGASSLIFGWLTFLIVRGLFTRKLIQIFIGLAVLAFYGSLLWGVLPGNVGISWQGHLFGAIGGVIAAWIVSADARESRKKQKALPAL
ncbi:rhomboid family intramembrane serine protease [Skermania sp. ID1734]|uniref:rhomboid family intramembrane serine protease n=1 Tax=Skermania sp. ID1734 TaxID=2597516 RepID=UPI0011814227|nr:rhomboid family intramembrane serine protease [Skermania sp. ID1734]TSD93348.1 rhomboid family intramembrane serine protease [Skermania sp. ID1734]